MKNRFNKTLSVFLTVCMMVGIFAGVWLGLIPRVEAVAASAITLTDSLGGQVVLSSATETATYSWDPETATLTLNGWNGQRINGGGDYNLHLKGTNTIQMAIAASGDTYGLGANMNGGSMGAITVTADEGGTLNILGNLTGANGTAIYGIQASYTNLINGKLNVDITSDGYGWMYGTWGSINFVDQTDGVDLDVRMESTYEGNQKFSIYGLYNSGLFYQPSYGAETAPQNVTVNVTAKGPQKAAVYAIGDIYIHSGYDGLDPDIDIVAVADNNGSTERECFAVHDLRSYYVGKNATLDCTGQVRSSSPDGDFYFNGHTQSTTPADNAYIWSVEDPEAIYWYFIATDFDGVPVEKFVLAYNETLPDLAWKGGANAKIPGGKIEDDSTQLYLLPYIKGASSYRTSDWGFKLKEGSALPEGLTLYSSGSIGGSATKACEAGEVTIVATDRMGTPYDSADDRTLEFTVAYDAWVEPDRFLQVGSDPKVEIRENGSGTGWSYDGTNKILTLNGYNGGPIQSEWDLHIHLVGENTITMVDEVESKGIFIDNYKGLLITAAEGGKLNVVGTLTHNYFYAIDGYLTVQGGELNVDVDATFGSNYYGYGIWGGVELTDKSQNVKVNVDIDVGGTGYGYVYGIYNGSLYYTEKDDSVTYPSATVSVNITGTEDVAVEAFNSINIQSANADIDIVAVASNNSSETKARYAVDDLSTFDVGPNVTLNCTGWVRRGGFTDDWEFNGHMQTTTPENNSFVWKRDEDTVNKPYPYFTMYQLDGKIVESAVFAYKEELGDLKWVGDGFISVPGAILGESFYGTDLLSGILGGSHYYASYLNTWKFEVIDGALPEGLSLHSSEGVIYGSRNHVYPAGEVTIRAIDKMGTEDDADDRYIDFTVSYGAVVSNNPVTGVTLNKDSLILEYDGSGKVTATVTPSDAAYPIVKGQMAGGYSNLYAESISDPENGASVVTIRANNFVGKATFIIATVENMGLYKELTVYVREKAPEISIDYRNEDLDGFSAGRTYIVTVDGIPTEIVPESYSIDLPEEWIGKTVSIVLKHDGEANCNSPAQELAIPERPAAPTTIGKTDASGAEEEDGSITGVADTMQYKQESQDSWYSVYSDAVNYLGIGTYHVRYSSTDTTLASKTATVVIGYGELAFTDNATFDILDDEISTDVSINVSTGVSGGKKPYTFSIDGPTWLSINATTGVISGTRPDTAQDATTATVTVTDGDSNNKSITINVGAVVLPHVHVYDQQKVEETYKKSDADCLNAAYYYYSCVCRIRGSEAFAHGEKLGHDYTEKLEDEAHLKQKGADCQHKNVYWYDCSRCAANAKDDPAATDKFYNGLSAGDHSFDTENWGYRGAEGHAHLCTVENCDAHDTPVAHTPGDEATELTPQLCTVCSYEIAPKKPHVHAIQKQNAASPDCTNPGNIAYYYCTGICGKYFSDEAGTQEIADKTNVILASLGHDYTEKLQNEAHVKGGGSNCKELYVYWYNCSRCTACAKDDAGATDKFYTGTLYGNHDYDQTKFAYRDAEGHARVCKVEGCGAYDMLRNHNKDTSTYQKDGTNHWYVCSDCGYEMSIEAHAYTNACDVDCNSCGNVRSITHDFEETLTKDSNKHWYRCTVCNAKKDEAAHVYANNCDATCDTCGHTRSITHSYASEWTKDENKHWHVCTVCGTKKDEAAHTPGVAATETTPQTCNVCGYVITPATGHITHNPADAWSKNETHHWHACVGCLEKQYDQAEHIYDNSCDTDCNTCGYIRTITHSYANEWTKDETKHWHACSVCGVKKDEAAHDYDNACDTACNICGHTRTTTHSYSNTLSKNDGKHWYECSLCGAKKDEVDHGFDHACDVSCDLCGYTRTVSHTYTETWIQNETRHWHACTVCGMKKDDASHAPGAAATETTPQACTVCGYIITPATGHVTHTPAAAWASDATHHWHECTGCQGQQLDKAEHTYDNDCDTDCNVCGKSRTVTHDYKAEWQKNESGHWHACSVCGAKKDESTHTPGAAATETTPQACTVCGYIITPATGHLTCSDGVKQNGQTATCTTPGWKDYYKCAGCEKLYEDESCTVQIADLAAWKTGNGKLSAAHNHGTVWKADANNHWNECACGDKANVAPHADADKNGKCDVCDRTVPITEPGTEPGTTPGNNEIKIENSESGASVQIPEGSSATVPDGAVFEVVELPKTEVAEETVARITETVEGSAEVLAVYDLSLLLDGAIVQPNGKLLVTLPAIEGDFDRIKVLYIADDGNVEECVTALNEDGTVSFETDHFSKYVVVGVSEHKADGGLPTGIIVVIVIIVILILGVGTFAIWWFSIEKKSFSDLVEMVKKNFSDLVEMVKKNLRTIGKKEPVANSAELDDESPADSESQDQ